MMNETLQIYKIGQFLSDRGIDPESFDIATELDRTLTFPENLKLIAARVGIETRKRRGDEEYCEFLAGKCELNCNAESCELFRSERCAGEVEPCPVEEPDGLGRIFCYRDLLIGEDLEEEEETSEYKRRKGRNAPPGYGVTLYFIEGTFAGVKKHAGVSILFHIIDLIAGHVKPARQFDVARDIEKLITSNDPVVTFVKLCIDAGTKKTRCYTDARAAGVSVRKQTQLALYDYLSRKEEPEIMPEQIPPRYDFFASVRDFIRDELMDDSWFGQFEYIESDLSECDASDIESADVVDPGDFVFEMGELESATLKYFGHYHRNTKMLVMRIYPEFNESGLEKLLKRR